MKADGITTFQKNGGKYPWPVEDSILTKEQLFVGKPRVKRAGVSIDMSEAQIKEWLKCKKDPIYFLKTYGRVVHVDRGLVPLELYPYQEEMIKNYQENRYNIALTCRQAGKTTAVVGFLAWYLIFHAEKDCHVLANKEAQAMEIMKRLRRLYEELPYFLQQGAVAFNQGNILFENGSSCEGHASSSDSIRGRSASLLYLDEMAFLANDEDFVDSVFPVVSSGETSKILITSTPKGARGQFHKIWQGSQGKGENWNGFKSLLVTWRSVPGRTEDWANKTRKSLGDSRFSQEHECKFLASAGGLISSNILEKMSFASPIHSFDDGAYEILTAPDKERLYVATVDCAEGVGQDNSVITIFDVTEKPYKVVATYHSNTISPLLFPYEIERICTQYNNAWCLVENNAVGSQIIQILYYEIEYENVFLTSAKKNGLGLQIGGSGAKPGIKTTKATKSIGCSNLKTLLETESLVIESEIMIDELGTFVANKTGSYEADEGAKDDTVMTLVLFSWLVKDPFFISEFETADKKTIQDRLKAIHDAKLSDTAMATFFSSTSMQNEDEERLAYLKNRSVEQFFADNDPDPYAGLRGTDMYDPYVHDSYGRNGYWN
ncbi:terminase DNA packaging enzyme large subunit [Acinetobacter phage SH-Ab 15599]|nr:terminase DNA packaging enzyme large subunit [Acinetobacter phage SH-Ab 15599]